MKKNINTQEANIRTIISIILILLALLIVNNAAIKIIFAVIAASLAGSAFMRICPIYTFMNKNTHENFENDVADDVKIKQSTEENPEKKNEEIKTEETDFKAKKEIEEDANGKKNQT